MYNNNTVEKNASCVLPSTPMNLGRSPGQTISRAVSYGVEGPPRWIVASGLDGTGWRASGDLKLVCNEAVQSRGREPGIHDRTQI